MTRRRLIRSLGVASASSIRPLRAAAAGSSRPNILLFLPDQWRHDWVGGSALDVRTPNLDALRSRGLWFRNAVCSSPLCAPSRAALMSGKEFDRCSVPSNAANYPAGQTTFCSLLRGAGYHVIGCGKLDLNKGAALWGLDGRSNLSEWGFSDGIDCAGKWDGVFAGAVRPRDPYMSFLHANGLAQAHVSDYSSRLGEQEYTNTAATPLPDSAYCDNWIGGVGLAALTRAPVGKPWFFQINFAGPHSPMDVTQRMKSTVAGRTYPLPNGSRDIEPAKHQEIRRNYTAMVENLDRWLGIYIAEIDRRGELENTLLVVSSDHGEMLGDHDRWSKTVPYEESVRIPLVVAGPGVRQSAETNALVSLIDLATTFLDYGQVARPSAMDSLTLRPLLQSQTDTHRSWLFSGLASWRMAFDGRYKLITGYDPDFETISLPRNPQSFLFDLLNDPLENNNLYSSSQALWRNLIRDMTARTRWQPPALVPAG